MEKNPAKHYLQRSLSPYKTAAMYKKYIVILNIKNASKIGIIFSRRPQELLTNLPKTIRDMSFLPASN